MSGERRKNKLYMTIGEQLDRIAEEMCDKYCKYPELCKQQEKDPKLADEMLMNVYCEHCPMTREI